jgi:hypothetical protein
MVNAVAVSADGKQVLTGSWDYSVRLWDLPTQRELKLFDEHVASVNGVAFVPGTSFALSGSWDATLKLWDLGSGKLVRSFEGHKANVAAVAVSRDGKRAASASWDRSIAIWDIATGRLLRSLNGHTANVMSVAFLPDGRTLFFMQPLYVCGPGAPVLALELSRDSNTSDIRGLGTLGGHGGSNLNAIGGTIRKGELLPGAPPMAHALKFEFFANLYYFRPPDGNRSRCFHWPATACDGYMSDCASQPRLCYNGTDALLTPGALLAVPAAAASALNASLRTAPARAILHALKNYGAYLVDDTAWNSTSICTEHGVADEFQAAYGFPYRVTANTVGAGAEWYADQLALFRALSIVTNNAPETPGGGGTPLQPLPPPFCA